MYLLEDNQAERDFFSYSAFLFTQGFSRLGKAHPHQDTSFTQSTDSNVNHIQKPSQTHPEIMFSQISGYPVSQSS